MITKLELSGENLKGAKVIGFIGNQGRFYNIQLQLLDGKIIDLVPEKSGTKGAIIQTIKTNF